MEPQTIQDGLAVYQFGKGPDVFLMPYPHASSLRSTADGRFAQLLTEAGFRVNTYDPPAFARSKRASKANLEEMLATTLECMDILHIKTPLPMIGHSMGGFCSLAFSLRHPEKVSKLVVSGSHAGWPDVRKYSIHKNWAPWQKKFWLSRYYGALVILGRASLKTHRQLDNLTNYESFYNKEYFEKLIISPQDRKLPAPPRSKWLKNVRDYNLESDLHHINLPVLITAGKHDPVVPRIVSMKMANQIKSSKLVIFENSGHSPFIEEKEYYSSILVEFLAKTNNT